MTPEPITPSSPRPVRRTAFVQRWTDLAYLHWPVDPALVAPLLPRGTTPDLHDGVTWVGLVPFVMRDVRVLGLPPLPHLSTFAETNVRLYAVDEHGRRGVVFHSLEAARLLPVVAARASYHLPYLWARMRVTEAEGTWTYTTRRRWPGPRGAGGEVAVAVGERFEAGPLEHFLSARWGLFSTFYGGRTVWAPVDHEPWPLHRAELVRCEDDLVAAAGLQVEGPPHVMWSPGVTVRVGRPQLLGRAVEDELAGGAPVAEGLVGQARVG